ncbi:MAG TPA: 30S ribosome-binding factor RbfA [bacterium]|nr:30S ribosome-binding factor RbfA [bacterium]
MTSSSYRMERVNELVREEVGRILLLESQDPRFVSVTVTGAKVTSDLNFAKVYVSILGTSEERDSVLSALGKASGFVRRQLGQQVRMKRTPQLTFVYDESLERANQIYKALEGLDLGSEKPETEETL